MDHPSEVPAASKVLIVDDSRVVALGLQRSIQESLGLEVDCLETYDEAREYLGRHARSIFLSILDLNLPGSPDGEIVDLFCSMSVPCIVFTSDFSEATRKKMLSKDIIDYVIKDAHAVGNIVSYIKGLIRNREFKVLVVEDSESFRFKLCSLLHKQMFQVIDVADAESALRMLEQHDDIRMIVTDYLMPGMDGVELTKAIRKRYGLEEKIVIGLSSSTDPMLTAHFIKSGANDFIAKPFSSEEFYCRVTHNVETSQFIYDLQEANRVKNEFLGMAAHDLRSPINGINGLSEMLLEGLCGEINDEQREIIEFIHSANTHMNHLVSDLLDISVIESGKLRLIKAEEDLVRLIESRLRIHGISAKQKSLSIAADLAPVAPFEFDQRRMGQVLDNLLTNAIKFSPANGSIDVSLEKGDSEVKVCVADHGQGVPPGEEELLFERFRKTSVQPTAGESSTGLGLPIVKKIVEAHGGRVWVESEYGQGATFCFTLPAG